jgi:hypothetical protein
MAATQGGTADTFLKFDHYVLALNNSSGGLAGFRWFGRMRMPNYAACTTANNNVFFAPPNSANPAAGLNWHINSGGGPVTNVPAWPFNSATDMTSTSSGAIKSTQAISWYTGAGSDGNFVPVQLSGSVPAPFSAGDIWWGRIDRLGNFGLFSAPGISNDSIQSPTAAATFTANPVVGFCPFTSLNFATVDGKYNFFQGAGSQTAETTLRMQINQTYWQSSGLIPPYDLTLSGSAFGGVIADTSYPYNWHPFCVATISQNLDQGGDSSFIGALKNIDVIDFYNQSVVSEKQIRIAGLAAMLMNYDLKDPTLDTVVNVSSNTYTGLPASNITIAWGGRGSTPAVGFTSPGPDGLAGPLGFNASDPSHMPSFAYWPYIRTGELQYFDSLTEIGIGAELNIQDRNPRVANGDSPYDVDGCVTYVVQQARGTGWALRNLECAALIAPWNPTNPTAVGFDGTQLGKYLNDLANISDAFPYDFWVANPSGIFNAYAQSAVLFTEYNYNIINGGPAYNNPPFWEQCYIGLGLCFGVARGSIKAKQTLEILAARAAYVGRKYGFYPLYHYNQTLTFANITGTNGYGRALITEDAQWVISQISAVNNSTLLSWAPNYGGRTNAFTLNAAPNNDWVPRNGDVIIPNAFNGASGYPPELNPEGPFFIVDYNPSPGRGKYSTFNLSKTLSGSEIAINSTGNGMIFNYTSSNPPVNTVPYAPNFMYQVQECAKWGQALGATGWGTTIADVNHRNTHGIGFGPNWHFKSGDVYNPVDARYCVQDTFG